MLARVARFAGSGRANAIAHRGIVGRDVARTFQSTRPTMMADQAKGVWDEPGTYSHPEGTPDGFTLRVQQTAENPTGVDVMMEKWEKGSEEPIHSHPGDDMTIVVEGKMSLQFFTKDAGGELVKDGDRVYLNQGDVGYVASNRIHDAKYHEACKLVYVHNKAFGFEEHK